MYPRTPKYIVVERKIRNAIKRGEIIDKLHGERDLAKEYEVSYMTIRKSIENLVNDNVLYKVPGRGTYVDNRNTARRFIQHVTSFLENRFK